MELPLDWKGASMTAGTERPLPDSAAVTMPAPPSPAEIVERIESWGIAKAALPLDRLLSLGVLAGLFIALGAAFFMLVVTDSLFGYGPTRLLGGVVFSFGLILVTFTGAELSTGNCLLVVPWLARRVGTAALLRNWVLSFLANAAGAVLLAVLVAASGVLDADGLRQTAHKIAAAKLALPPMDAFVRGALCNMLVCLAVWLSFAATTAPGKTLALVLPIAAFVALGFEHSIANLYLLPLDMLAGGEVDLERLAMNVVPVTLGNLVGGVAISAMLGGIHRRPSASGARQSGAGWARGLGTAAGVVGLIGASMGAAHQFGPPVSAQLISAQAPVPAPAAAPASEVVPADIQARLQRFEDHATRANDVLTQLQSALTRQTQEIVALRAQVLAPAPTVAEHRPAEPAASERGRGDAPRASCPVSAGQAAETIVLRFARRQDALAADQRTSLERVAAAGVSCTQMTLTIAGYTDNRGATAANLLLSRHRAALVAAYLTARGVEVARLDVVGYGAQSPVASNETEQGRDLNRRIEITLRASP